MFLNSNSSTIFKFNFSCFKWKAIPSLCTISVNTVSLIIVKILVMFKLRSRGSNSNFRFLLFVKSATCKSIDSVLGLNFCISTPVCWDDSLDILTRRSRFLGEKLTQLWISSSVYIIKLKYFVFLFFAKLVLLISYR